MLLKGQMGFFDVSIRSAGLDAKSDPLAKLNAIVPWACFRPQLEAVWRRPPEARKSKAGGRPRDAVVMFKALLLCERYDLSDEQFEYQVRDRLSFMRFLGLGLEVPVPDATTAGQYREQLVQAGVKVTDAATHDNQVIGDVLDDDNTASDVWERLPDDRYAGSGQRDPLHGP